MMEKVKEEDNYMQLRPYQQDMINDIKKELRSGHRSVCAVLGCGGGKSVIQARIAKSATDKGNRVLFIVHRRELLQQIKDTFEQCGVNFDLCHIGMVQTVTRHLDNVAEPKVIITDEAHHALSKSYTRIYDYFPQALRLGFTATPIRMNEGGLGRVFNRLVEGISTKMLIENKYLSPYRCYGYQLADASKLDIENGDYNPSQLAKLMERKKIYGDTVEIWSKHSNDGQTIVYCASINASQSTANEFNMNGISAAHLDGKTSDTILNTTVEKFRRGEIKVLCNCELFGEGFDVPDCSVVVLLRPTKSLTVHIQQSMRSMRYKEDKTAIIIDHVGNVFEHGLPDTERTWSLEEKEKGMKKPALVKKCPKCNAMVPIKCEVCDECGYEFIVIHQDVIKEFDVEFSVITPDMIRDNYWNYRKCKTFDELCQFQRVRNMSFGWVLHRCVELNIDPPVQYASWVTKQRRILS